MQSESGAGLHGMRPLHMQQMLSRDTAEWDCRLLSALTSLVNIFLSGNIVNFVFGALSGVSLCALSKKKMATSERLPAVGFYSAFLRDKNAE